MKLSELITNLQEIQSKIEHDPQVVPNVRDSYYTNHGHVPAEWKIDPKAMMHGGYTVNDQYMVINVDILDDYEGKSPKISFRK